MFVNYFLMINIKLYLIKIKLLLLDADDAFSVSSERRLFADSFYAKAPHCPHEPRRFDRLRAKAVDNFV